MLARSDLQNKSYADTARVRFALSLLLSLETASGAPLALALAFGLPVDAGTLDFLPASNELGSWRCAWLPPLVGETVAPLACASSRLYCSKRRANFWL